MENHPLNLAHQQHRRADAHLMNNKFDEAMQCHHNAAELLLDAMKSTTSSVALESITLQHSYHLKQKDLIKSKKEQYGRIKKAMENIKQLGNEQFQNTQVSENTRLQVAIYRNITETDSILQTLSKNNSSADSGKLKDATNKIDITDGRKIEKNDNTVIEELQTLNQNLHYLVEQLVLQVEVLKDENKTMKEKINYLEKERVKYLNLPLTYADILAHRNNLPPMNGTGEDFSKVPMSRVINTVQPLNTPGMEQAHQQTHFDLSALKDD